MNPSAGHTYRLRLDVRGRVQGVGFRPFVYRLATEEGLAGSAGNDTHGAFIEIEGATDAAERFMARLRDEAPRVIRITELDVREIPERGDTAFRIEQSLSTGRQDAEITPDLAVCGDCLRELFDAGNRRYRYPFINCTNCGPRYSIIRGVPYDRPNTTMAAFEMCPECRSEYENPGNRRFHAQPNACPICGPRVWLTDQAEYGKKERGEGTPSALPEDPIRACAQRLRDGAIVAIKGIGGFHLACLAANDRAVAILRERKNREAKPFALMTGSLEAAGELIDLDEAVRAALLDSSRPIVLAPKRRAAPVSEGIAPRSSAFGLMLPYTPLHHLLFAEGLGPLVMTSGNPSEEPLCSDNEEALQRLGHIADAFLLHDRDIARRLDDSVVLAVPLPEPFSKTRHEDSPSMPRDRRMPVFCALLPLRRARGLAPEPIRVPCEAAEPVLAVGGELKSSICLLRGRDAVLSEHLGELSNPAAYRNFVRTMEAFQKLLRIEPRVIACDMHPDYASSRFAESLMETRSDFSLVRVQHHHAHIAGCLAENGATGRVIGVACDGTGYGTDGHTWGCEILICDETSFERAGHLRYYPLLGGDAAARDTWRPAVALLADAWGDDWRKAAFPILKHADQEALEFAASRIKAWKDGLEKNGPAGGEIRFPLTSSLGRLFDAAAFLSGLCIRNRYEAEAAMTLEAEAARCPETACLPYAITDETDGPFQIDPRPLIRALVRDADAGRPVAEMALAFHETVAAMLADAVDRAAHATGLDRVVLSGGCFANQILTRRLVHRLSNAGYETLLHRHLPTGDGGIALGQAVVGAENIEHENLRGRRRSG